MKAIVLLTSIAGLAVIAFFLGLAFDSLNLACLAIAAGAWFAVLGLHAYAPARRSWLPRRARAPVPAPTSAPARREPAFRLAA